MESYSVGMLLDNALECSDPSHPWVIEIMGTWVDPDDREIYYIIKCIESPRYQHGWYYEGQVEIVSEVSLEKYFQIRS